MGEIETQCKRHNKFLLASFHPSVYERDLQCLEIVFVEFNMMLFFISYKHNIQRATIPLLFTVRVEILSTRGL